MASMWTDLMDMGTTVPDKIVRTREQRLWHEDWTYDVRLAARRLLRFVNGKLAGVDTEPIVEVSNGSLASLETSRALASVESTRR